MIKGVSIETKPLFDKSPCDQRIRIFGTFTESSEIKKTDLVFTDEFGNSSDYTFLLSDDYEHEIKQINDAKYLHSFNNKPMLFKVFPHLANLGINSSPNLS